MHDVPQFLKGASKVVVAAEQVPDGQEDLSDARLPHIGLYSHRGQDGRTSKNGWGL
jgi:hypothetical protein